MLVTRLCILVLCSVEVDNVVFFFLIPSYIAASLRCTLKQLQACQDGLSRSSATPVRDGLPLGVGAIPSTRPKTKMPNPQCRGTLFVLRFSSWSFGILVPLVLKKDK